MYTPHPSLVPMEMASAGMLTVTNTLREQGRRRRCAAISANLIAAEPTLDGVTRGLLDAAAAVEDAERRVDGQRHRLEPGLGHLARPRVDRLGPGGLATADRRPMTRGGLAAGSRS